MKLLHLKEELEPQAPDGKVLIGWYVSPVTFQYANYVQNIHDALGPMADIRSTRRVRLTLIGHYPPSNVAFDGSAPSPEGNRRRQVKIKIERIDDLLVIDREKVLDYYQSVFSH